MKKQYLLITMILSFAIVCSALFSASFLVAHAAVPTFGVDPNCIGFGSNSSSHCFSATTSTMTAQPNELVIVSVASSQCASGTAKHSPEPQIFWVSDSFGTDYMLRGMEILGGSGAEQISEYYATTGAHTGSFTITACERSSSRMSIDVSAFGILGANTTSPFDPQAVLPHANSYTCMKHAQYNQEDINSGQITQQKGCGIGGLSDWRRNKFAHSITPTVFDISTLNANDLILGFEGQLDRTTQTSGSFFTGSILNNANGEGDNVGYATVTSPLSSKTISFGTPATNWVMMVDAVKEACSVSISPSSVTLDAGQSQTFTATVYGGNSLTYQWYLDGSAVPGANAATYSYNASGTSHSIYVAVVDSINGHFTSNTAAVTVNSPPTVTISSLTASVSPSHWVLDAGQTVNFTANPTGGSGTYKTYQWFVNGTLQNDETSSTYNYSSESLGTYLITVKVTDSLNEISAPSAPAFVLVNAYPNVTIDASQVLDVGQSQTYAATVTGGTPPFTYQWYVNGAPVGTNSSSYTFTATASDEPSVIISVRIIDSASSPVTVSSPTVTVVVNNHPSATLNIYPNVAISSGETLDVGQSQEFSVNITGGTSPFTYQWYLDGSPVGSNSPDYTFTATALDEPSVNIYASVTDSASTPVTVSSATITVTVNPLPTVSISPNSWTMNIDSSKAFTANPTGGSLPYTGYQWYVNGTLQADQTSSTFAYDATSLGSFSITATVTDTVNVTSVQSPAAIVTVSDVAPTITAPNNVAVVANTLGGATDVNLGSPSVSSITYTSSQLKVTNNATSLFPIGSTVVSWTVTDPSGLTATATQTVTVNAGTAVSLTIDAPSSAKAGAAFSVTVTAHDEYGNVAAGYSGTVHFTSTSAGTLPSDSALSKGNGTFSATLTKVGSQTITAVDKANSQINGTSGFIVVSSGLLDHITISPSVSTISAGTSQSYSVTAYDAYGNTLGDVTSAATFAAPGATVSGNTVSAANAGTYSVTATYDSKTATATLIVNAASQSTTTKGSGTSTISYSISFKENGLSSGQEWNVTFNGSTESSTTGTIVFDGVPAGSYSWTTQTINVGAGEMCVPSSTSGAVDVPATSTVTITYTTQYYLTVNSVYGNPTGQGWYNAGTTANFGVTSPDTSLSTQRFFKSWTGTGVGSYSGSDNTQSVTMNNPITETAKWATATSTSLYIILIVAIIIFAAALTAFSVRNWRKQKNKPTSNPSPT